MDQSIKLPIQYEYEYFSAPGFDGMSCLRIKSLKNSIIAEVCQDITDSPKEWSIAAKIENFSNWRDIIAAVTEKEYFCYIGDENIYPKEIRYTGEANFITDLIGLSFCGGEIAQAALCLTILSDTYLDNLHTKYRSFTSDKFCNQLVQIYNLAAETDITFSVFLRRHSHTNSDMSIIRKDIRNYAKLCARKDLIVEAIADWHVHPFATKIEAFMKSWRASQPVSSAIGQRGVFMRANSIKKYLNYYIAQNGSFPIGSHDINIDISSNNPPDIVDFGE